MNYKDLEIWKISNEIVIEIHQMTLSLPPFELYETAAQIRRSSKSVKSNIVEGFGRRRYKSDFIKFLIHSLSSNDETIDHLETLYQTNSLKDEKLYLKLHENLVMLGKKINRFISVVEKKHNQF